MENRIPLRFFVVTFLWSWLIWAALVLAGAGIIPAGFLSKISLPMMLLGAFGPVAGTIVSLYSLEGKGAIKNHFKSYWSLNFGWKAWLAIFIVLNAIAFIAWILPEFFGSNRLPAILSLSFIIPYLLLMIFLGGGQEEVGWRAYILPIFEKKFGLIIGSLIIGIIWAVWHIPLWFIPGTGQSYMNFLGFTFMCIGYSYFFSWVIKASGNRFFSGLIVHGVANTVLVVFPFLIMEDNVKQIRYWIYCLLILVIGVTIVMIRTVKAKNPHLTNGNCTPPEGS